MTVPFPFTDDGTVRTFSGAVEADELQWHWDEQDRLVTPLHHTDWLFQFDNQQPQPLEAGISFFISAGTWHRLIKGTGDLHLNILKYELPHEPDQPRPAAAP